MKKLCYLLLTIFLSVNINCKEENLLAKTTIGTWELRQVSGGFTGKITNYVAGNGSLLKFTKDTYQIFTDNKLMKSGSFKIVKETSILTHNEGDRIIYDDETNGMRNFISIENNKLYISMDVYDGQTATYERVD